MVVSTARPVAAPVIRLRRETLMVKPIFRNKGNVARQFYILGNFLLLLLNMTVKLASKEQLTKWEDKI